MEIVQKVLEDFDPSKRVDEDEAIFESQFAMFDKTKADTSSNIRQRRGIEKKVREGYFEEMQQAMETHDRLLAEKERKAKNTATLQKRMAEIAKENEASKKALQDELEEAKRKQQEVEAAVKNAKIALEELKQEEGTPAALQKLPAKEE